MNTNEELAQHCESLAEASNDNMLRDTAARLRQAEIVARHLERRALVGDDARREAIHRLRGLTS